MVASVVVVAVVVDVVVGVDVVVVELGATLPTVNDRVSTLPLLTPVAVIEWAPGGVSEGIVT